MSSNKVILFDPSLVYSNLSDSWHERENGSLRSPPRLHDNPSVLIHREISEKWIVTLFTILGVVGNLVSLYVLSKYRRRQKLKTVLILLRTLAVADTLVLLNSFFLRTLRVWVYRGYFVNIWTLSYPRLLPIMYVLRMANTWLTVLLTIDRFLAVCRPLHAHLLCTVKRTYLEIAGITIFSVGFCIPRFFEYEIRYFNDTRFGFFETKLIVNKYYVIVYQIALFIFFQYLLPLGLLAWLNISVIVSLRQSDACRRTHFGRSGQNTLAQTPTSEDPAGGGGGGSPHPAYVTAAFQSTRNVAVVVVVVVFVCIVSMIINTIAHVIYVVQIGSEKKSPTYDLWRRHLAIVSNLVTTINSASNFIIYCFCSRNFRLVLLSQICCCLRRKQPGSAARWVGCWTNRRRRRMTDRNSSSPAASMTTRSISIPTGSLIMNKIGARKDVISLQQMQSIEANHKSLETQAL